MKADYLNQIVAGLLIFLFAYSAINKLIDYEMFHAQLSIYPFIRNASWVLTVSIPLIEFIIVIMLIMPSARGKGFFASAVLLSLFTVYLILMINTKNNLPCSCGGVIENLSWKGHIGFNLFFIILAFIGTRLEKRQTEVLSKITPSNDTV